MLSFGYIIIPSKDPAFTSKFMSFIFDDEPFYNEPSDIRFLLGEVEIRILKENRRPGQHEFIFFVKDPVALSELKNKIEFFCYTNNLSIDAPTLTENQLRFVDSQAGIWIFEAEREKFTPIVDKKTLNVSFG